MEKVRDFVFTDGDFESIRGLVSRHTGISLSEAKKDMVYSRLSRRLRVLNLDSFKDYLKLVSEKDDDELIQFTNAITTNLTSFFREQHHFDYLAHKVIPALLKENAQSRKMRIWCAGCSTGEEPYSLAIILKEVIPPRSGWDVKILATDLDSNVLAKAKSGVYEKSRIEGLPSARAKKWFLRSKDKNAEQVCAHPDLKELITFKQLNLLDEWPMKGPFDIIFCRNVVIYFNKDTQRILFNRYADILKDDSHLFIGHSESLFKVSDRFKLLGQTIYRKIR